MSEMDDWADTYKVYYGVIDPHEIINVLINPTRGEKYIETMNNVNKFYEKLEKSIIQLGFRNPILVNCGLCYPLRESWLPKEVQGNLTNKIICDKCGGSRLYVAKKLNIPIPCIISDFCNRFENDPNFKRIVTVDEMYKYFKDLQSHIRLSETGVHLTSLQHIHLY